MRFALAGLILISSALPIGCSPTQRVMARKSHVTHTGFGIVERLKGTGDSIWVLPQSTLTADDEKLLLKREIAAVEVLIIESEGENHNQRVIRVQAIGDATSLFGGVLRSTSLESRDPRHEGLRVSGRLRVDDIDGLTVATVK